MKTLLDPSFERNDLSNNLPKGWRLTSVGELFHIIGGGTPSTKILEYWEGDIPWISSADIYGLKKIVPRRNINQNAISNSAANLVPKGSIIVVTRVSLGKIAISQIPISFSQDCHALIPKEGSIDPEFALYYLSQAVQSFKHQSRGTTIPGVTVKVLSSLLIPLPPLPEQHRIVARIEALLSQVNAACDRLNRVPLIMKRFRQAVLAAACSGRLTEGWREENSDVEPANRLLQNITSERNDLIKLNIIKPLKWAKNYNNPTEIFEIPDNWIWVSLGDLCHIIADGPHVSPQYVSREGGIPFLSARNVKIDRFDLDTAKYISKEDYEQFSTRINLKKGDILYTKGGTTGIARVNDLDFPIHIWVHIAALRVSQKLLNPYYLANTLNSRYCYEQSQMFTQGITNHDLGLSRMVYIKFPLPPLPEQHEIVRHVDALFALADQIEQQVAEATKRTDALTQAVLAKAFRGELVATEAELCRKDINGNIDHEPPTQPAIYERKLYSKQ